ncbi:MAG: CBS domain-containing protein [Bacilli bacterium]|nr:CBS domain-containing protein [Bacilli bacterium]
MNTLFFLTPKSEVCFLYDYFSVRQALEKMEYHHYSRIPVLNKDGDYVGDITEGDLLWFIKKNKLNIKNSELYSISQIYSERKLEKIKIDADINELIRIITTQNYVPVVDDRNKFIGIVTRTKVISYLKEKAGF